MNATEPKTEAEKALDEKAAQIAKLLNKAESTTPEEAQALNEHAQRLMAKYAIDQARIDANRALGKKESIIQEVIDCVGSWAIPEFDFVTGAANNMSIKPLVGSRKNGKYVRLIGFESDVRQLQALFASIQIQAGLALREAIMRPGFYTWQTTAVEKYQARRDFMLGFMAGALSQMRRVREQVLAEEKAAEAKAAAGETVGTELVLVQKDERIATYMAENFGRLGTARATRIKRGGGLHYGEGAEAGRRANVNGRTEIGGSRKGLK